MQPLGDFRAINKLVDLQVIASNDLTNSSQCKYALL